MSAIIVSNSLGEIGMKTAVAALKAKRSLLDVIEEGIVPVEADPSIPHVGIGGAPNLLGELETDAAIMDGDTLDAGAIGALKGYISAVRTARKVLEVLPHVMLVGNGAALFARENGIEEFKQLPEEIVAQYNDYIKKRVPEDILLKWPDVPLSKFSWPVPDVKDEKDTVIYLARNSDGQIAGGTSTSGWAYKYPGRLGDSPIIGAGLYADSKYGACACTHTGEMTVRAGTARSVICYMKAGASVIEAAHEAVNDLRRLKGGYLGPVVIHAIDNNGEPYVVSTTKENVNYWLWNEETDKIQSLKAVVDEVKI